MSHEDKIAALEQIRAKAGGILQPEDVVKAAHNPKHVLHDEFPWDDSVAAHKYRLVVARALIRNLRVDIIVEGVEVQTVFYINDPGSDDKERGYIPLSTNERKTDEAARIMAIELDRLEGIIQRTRSISIVLGVRQDVDNLLTRISKIQIKLEQKRKVA